MAAKEVIVDSRSRRSDHDALEGGFCVIEKGKYAGRVAVLEKVLLRGEKGYPTGVQVRTRDADSVLVSLPYENVRAELTYKGGR